MAEIQFLPQEACGLRAWESRFLETEDTFHIGGLDKQLDKYLEFSQYTSPSIRRERDLHSSLEGSKLHSCQFWSLGCKQNSKGPLLSEDPSSHPRIPVMVAKEAWPNWESNHEAATHFPCTTEQMSDVNEFDSVPPRSWILWTRSEKFPSLWHSWAHPPFLREEVHLLREDEALPPENPWSLE